MAVTMKQKPLEPITLYRFGTVTEGAASMKDILGGKGANLAEMSSIGLPVPPGFTIPCEASITFKKTLMSAVAATQFLDDLWEKTNFCLEALKEHFQYPPLLSVRSGARVSMPGMMDTILNVGLTTETLPFWKEKLGERPALDSYRRLIQMYSSVALGVDMGLFVEALDTIKKEAGVSTDSELNPDHLERLVSRYKKIVTTQGKEFPDTVQGQIQGAVLAVFESWDNPRAIEYRKIHGYPDNWGTAVTIQAMVFGNLNDNSATGVLFSRDPSSGANEVVGEFLVNAQGEDVVAGIRTPLPIEKIGDMLGAEIGEELFNLVVQLENHYKDMQDIEFTVQDGKLYLLQTRNGKRSPMAAFKIAHDLVDEEIITKKEAVGRVTQTQLLYVMQDTIDPKFKTPAHLTGIAAGGGVVSGVAVFTSDAAVNSTEPCILVRKETDPDDIAGMNASVGILTATGGLTSHAAVVARGMNKSCVVGCTDMYVSINAATINAATVNSYSIHVGTKLTIDGATGRVWIGLTVPVVAGGAAPEVRKLLSWTVAEEGGVSERLEISSHSGMDDMLHAVQSVACQSLQIDTAMLEGPDSLDTVRVKIMVEKVGMALESFAGTEIVVDLNPLSSFMKAPDHMLSAIFGSDKLFDTTLLMAKVEKLLGWPISVREKTIVKLPDNAGNVSKMLVASGIKVMGKVTTVGDLLVAGGPMEVSETVIQQVFGSHEAYVEIRGMIEAAKGKSLSGKAMTPMYWYDFLSKVA